jgi:two-component system sensor histidine kinase KdpD
MRRRSWFAEIRDLALACAAVAGVTGAYARWLDIAHPTLVALTYLLVVLLVAAVSRLWVAIGASLLVVLCLNFFFLPPVGTLTIADPENWIVLFVLLVVSVVASQLSSSVRSRADEALARRDELARLFDLSRDILLTTDGANAHQSLAQSIARRFGLDYVAVCLPAAGTWQIRDAGVRPITLTSDVLDPVLHEARQTLEFDARARAYAGHARVTSAEGRPVDVIPLRLGGRAIGLLALSGRSLEPGTRDALAGVAAIAVERAQFLEDRRAAEFARQRDELKSALLASLGHDLRTPLTAIRVAASNLQAGWAGEAERREQSEIVLTEVERLSRLFQNILDMARIETSAVAAEREWVTPAELVEAAVAHVEQTLRRHRLAIEAESDRVVQVDPRVTSAALAHLIENAALYSPEGSTIHIDATATEDELRIAVGDEGRGIAHEDLPHLFERFYRGRSARRQSSGTGMGLAITRGLLAAQGGRVWAENAPAGGAVFSIAVPTASRAAAVQQADD